MLGHPRQGQDGGRGAPGPRGGRGADPLEFRGGVAVGRERLAAQAVALQAVRARGAVDADEERAQGGAVARLHARMAVAAAGVRQGVGRREGTGVDPAAPPGPGEERQEEPHREHGRPPGVAPAKRPEPEHGLAGSDLVAALPVRIRALRAGAAVRLGARARPAVARPGGPAFPGGVAVAGGVGPEDAPLHVAGPPADPPLVGTHIVVLLEVRNLEEAGHRVRGPPRSAGR